MPLYKRHRVGFRLQRATETTLLYSLNAAEADEEFLQCSVRLGQKDMRKESYSINVVVRNTGQPRHKSEYKSHVTKFQHFSKKNHPLERFMDFGIHATVSRDKLGRFLASDFREI